MREFRVNNKRSKELFDESIKKHSSRKLILKKIQIGMGLAILVAAVTGVKSFF